MGSDELGNSQLDVTEYIPQEAIQYLQQIKQTQTEPIQVLINIPKQTHALNACIKHVAASDDHVLVATHDGKCFAWGSNQYGKLGTDKLQAMYTEPILNACLLDHKVVMCAAGGSHSLFLTKTGQVFSAGLNDCGQLGCQSEAIQHDCEEVNIEQKTDAFYHNRTQRAAQLVKVLDNISYIACGKNHSCAISSIASHSDKTALYTWGSGAYGQLGHSQIKNQHNVSIPTQVKIDADIVMVCCQSKHTVLLDAENNIWYFGVQDKVGVSTDSHYQFEPKKLIPKTQELFSDTKFVFISAGEDLNLAVALEDSNVFKFGHRLEKQPKKVYRNAEAYHETTFERVLYDNEYQYSSNLKAKFVSCGQNRYSVIDVEERSAFVWQSSECPSQVSFFVGLMEEYSKNVKVQQKVNKIELQEQDIKPQRRQLKFQVQEDLKFMGGVNNPQEAIKIENLDNLLQSQFQQVCKEYHEMITQANQAKQDLILRTQDAIITRVLNFPCNINTLQSVQSILPNFIVQNKQLYEVIFTALQMHPCYLIQMLQHHFDQPSKISHLIHAVFGQTTMLDNQLTVNSLLIIAYKMLQQEVEKKPLVEVLSVNRKTSPFLVVFRIIFSSQSQNLRFIRGIVNDLIASLVLDQDLYSAMVNSLSRIAKKFDQMTKQETADASNRQGDKLSHEVVSLLCLAYKVLMGQVDVIASKQRTASKQTELKVRYKKQIKIYLYSLVLDLAPFQDYTYEQILLQVWDQKSEIRPDLFLAKTGKSVFCQLILQMRTYLCNRNAELASGQIQELIRLGKPTGSSITPYRDTMSHGLLHGYKPPIDFEMVLIQQLFQSACDLEDSHLTISVEDLIIIQNTLISNKIQIHDDDPILLMFKELGADVVTSEFDPTTINAKINLKIQTRQLLANCKFVKCKECYAPVTLELIGESRFNDAFNGKKWRCDGCSKLQQGYLCRNCNSTIQKSLLPADLVYDRYTDSTLSPQTIEFSEVLMQLPNVEDHQEFSEVLQSEIERMDKLNMPQQMQKLLQFKQGLENHVNLEEHKLGQNKSVKDKIVFRSVVRNKQLQGLAQQVEMQIRQKETHYQKVKQYQKLFPNLQQKRFDLNYRQAHNKQILDQIVTNSYTGLSSDFLKQILKQIGNAQVEAIDVKNTAANVNVQMIWAGRLQVNDKVLQEIQKTAKNKLHEYFREVEKQGDLDVQAVKQKSLVKTYPYIQLVRNKVIIKGGQYDQNALRDSKLVFSYAFLNGQQSGFNVELIYKSEFKVFECFTGSSEAVLEQFHISKDALTEMRRNFATQAVAIFGTTHFRIFELTKLLNGFVAGSDIFQEARDKIVTKELELVGDVIISKKKVILEESDVQEWDVQLTSLNEIQETPKKQKIKK